MNGKIVDLLAKAVRSRTMFEADAINLKQKTTGNRTPGDVVARTITKKATKNN